MNTIKEHRKKMGLTQIELARALNITQGALSGYETGRYDPDTAMMRRMAKFFSTSLDELFGVKDDDDQNREIGEIDFALSGAIRDLTDNEKLDILDYVNMKKAQRARLKNAGEQQ